MRSVAQQLVHRGIGIEPPVGNPRDGGIETGVADPTLQASQERLPQERQDLRARGLAAPARTLTALFCPSTMLRDGVDQLLDTFARSCGGALTDCDQGCITFGIAASQYATCGPETSACPP